MYDQSGLVEAYESIEWMFIEQMLKEIGFPSMMVTWTMVCIRTVSYTLMLNGNLSETFPAKRGLKQWDLMSPYFFVIVMEYLVRCMGTLQTEPDFNYHPRCKKLGITHLCLADDLIMFAGGNKPLVSLIKEKFLQFSAASSLKTNMSKSQVYFGGVTMQKQQGILGILGYELGELRFKYLGRIQLIKAMLFGVQAYWAQLFLLPKKVMKLIEAVCRSYLWTGEATISKRALVAWDKVCLPREASRLNLLDLKIWNQAAICKLLRALSLRKEKLWITWIHTYYIKRQEIGSMNTPSQASWMVKKIFNMRRVRHTMDVTKIVQGSKFLISKVYTAIRGDVQNVEWKHLVCHNCA
ncbi:uncharacterized protein LOC132644239 [Lycium barbarum]|uniref:uncharacterized protein LOC132644239 n=1 Tax=Lycium barbarum TaxID=112863 RepID=UPI00293E7988|nr:uncharacterized protein LOC132644239 [Lycium barbarum]